jgi:hypothetical protein
MATAKQAIGSLEIALSTHVKVEGAWRTCDRAVREVVAEGLPEVYDEAKRLVARHDELTATVGSRLGREPSHVDEAVALPAIVAPTPGRRPPTRAESHGEKVALLRRRILDLEQELATVLELPGGHSPGPVSRPETPMSPLTPVPPSTPVRPQTAGPRLATASAPAAPTAPAAITVQVDGGAAVPVADLAALIQKLAAEAGKGASALNLSLRVNLGAAAAASAPVSSPMTPQPNLFSLSSSSSLLAGTPKSPGRASSAPPSGQCDLYISYCSANATDAEGRLSGSTDVLKCVEALEQAGLRCWLSSHPPTLAQAVGALSQCRAFLAFISDDYLKDRRCVGEFKFVCSNTRMPMYAGVVGPALPESQWTWRTDSDVGLLLAEAPSNLQAWTPEARESFKSRVNGVLKGGQALRTPVTAPPLPADALYIDLDLPALDPRPCAAAFTEPVRRALAEVVGRFSSAKDDELGREDLEALLRVCSDGRSLTKLSAEDYEAILSHYGRGARGLAIEGFLSLLYFYGEERAKSVLRRCGYGVGLQEVQSEAPPSNPAATTPASASASASANAPRLFASYVWSDSAEAVGTRASGPVDPRAVMRACEATGKVSWWVDSRALGAFGAREKRLAAMKECGIFVAFLSEAYALAEDTLWELKMAANVLRLPIVGIVVGAPQPVADWFWMSTDVGALFEGASFFDFQSPPALASNAERFVAYTSTLAADLAAERTVWVLKGAAPRPAKLTAPRLDFTKVYTSEDRSAFTPHIAAAVAEAIGRFSSNKTEMSFHDTLALARATDTRPRSHPLTEDLFKALAAANGGLGPQGGIPIQAFLAFYLKNSSKEKVTSDLVLLGYSAI